MSDPDRTTSLVPPDDAFSTEPDAGFNDGGTGSGYLASGRPLSIRSHWKFKLIGWLALITALIFAALSANARVFEGLVVGSLMAGMGGLLLLFARASLRVDTNGILLIRPLARYRIRWDEVQKIEFSSKMDRIVFYGHDKWLVIPQVVPVVSGQKIDFARFLAAMARQRRIPISFSAVTPRDQKNTRCGF